LNAGNRINVCDWISAIVVQQSENIESLFLLPAGEGQDEGERDDIPNVGDQQKGI
jgi:hypothetical protein